MTKSESASPDVSDNSLTPQQREELLRRSWMANDALWFYHTATTQGIDTANELNAKVVQEFGRQEMTRLMRSIGVQSVTTIAEYRALMELTRDIFLGSLMDYDDQIIDGAHRIEVNKCFAFLGVRRAGIEEVYRCGPGARVQGWLKAMSVDENIEPQVGLCQMAHQGKCHYTIHTGLSS